MVKGFVWKFAGILSLIGCLVIFTLVNVYTKELAINSFVRVSWRYQTGVLGSIPGAVISFFLLNPTKRKVLFSRKTGLVLFALGATFTVTTTCINVAMDTTTFAHAILLSQAHSILLVTARFFLSFERPSHLIHMLRQQVKRRGRKMVEATPFLVEDELTEASSRTSLEDLSRTSEELLLQPEQDIEENTVDESTKVALVPSSIAEQGLNPQALLEGEEKVQRAVCDRPSYLEIAGTFIGFIGLVVAVLESEGLPADEGASAVASFLGDSIAFVASVSFTIFVAIARNFSDHYPISIGVFAMNGFGCIFYLALGSVFTGAPYMADGESERILGSTDGMTGMLDWPYTKYLFPHLFIFFIAGVFGQYCTFIAMKHLPVVAVSLCFCMLPVTSILLGNLMGIAQNPGALTIVGGTMLICGLVLVSSGSSLAKKIRNYRSGRCGDPVAVDKKLQPKHCVHDIEAPYPDTSPVSLAVDSACNNTSNNALR